MNSSFNINYRFVVLIDRIMNSYVRRRKTISSQFLKIAHNRSIRPFSIPFPAILSYELKAFADTCVLKVLNLQQIKNITLEGLDQGIDQDYYLGIYLDFSISGQKLKTYKWLDYTIEKSEFKVQK